MVYATINAALLGKQVEDTVTGLKGTAIARITFMNGCVQYQIQPKTVVDGVPAEAKWYDDEQVRLVNKRKVTKKKRIGAGGPPPKSTPHKGK